MKYFLSVIVFIGLFFGTYFTIKLANTNMFETFIIGVIFGNVELFILRKMRNEL